MNVLNPMSVEDFNEIAKNENPLNISNFEEFFKEQIEIASSYAVGPYFWFIGNNHEMKIVVASQNIGELTPFSVEQWTNSTALFLVENLHPDDGFYVLSALNLAVQKIEELPTERHSNIRVNIYARMLNASNEYRWVLIQMPRLYINKINRTTCAIIMITDLSHLSFNEKPVLMTLTDKVANQNIYFNIANDEMKLINADLPHITKREHEILLLMAKGLNSPQIAEKLFLSYHTIENHKRNLRQKTNTKTSVELIHYVWHQNLI